MRQLFKSAEILSCAGQGHERASDMRVQDGRIVEIGVGLESNGDEVVDLGSCWLVPGFVQSHVHLCQTLFRGMAENRALLEWLGERIWPLEAAHDEESTYISARLGIAEMLLSGTTAFLDMGSLRHTSASFTACEEAGVRATSGRALMDRENPAGLHASHEENLKGACEEADEWHMRGRLRYAFAPRFVPSCSESLLKETLVEARKRGALIHTHASENTSEIALVRELTGRENIAYFDEIGMLGPDVALAHCIHLSEGEMSLLAKSGSRVLHCPSSNMKLASGIAPIPELLERGVHVSIGADGAPCNNRLDPFAEMRKAGLLQSLRLGPGHLTPATILEMMTIRGAEALGIADEVGSLEAGKSADFVAINADHPTLMGDPDPVHQVVYAAGPEHVEAVYIAGERRVHRGRLENWGPALDFDEIRAAATRVREAAGL